AARTDPTETSLVAGRRPRRRHEAAPPRWAGTLPDGRHRRPRARRARSRGQRHRRGPPFGQDARGRAHRARRSHRRGAVASRRRAPRPRPPRSRDLPARHDRSEPHLDSRRQALRGRSRRVRRRPHAARRDGRSGQRAGGRRHRAADRQGDPSRRHEPRGHPRPDLAADAPGPGRRRRRGGGRSEPGRGRRPARVRRRRAGHPPGQPDHRPGRRAGRLRRASRADRQRVARALPDRRRARRVHDGAAADGARRHQPHEDHERPRHLRAAHTAGRSRRPDDRRPQDRPARRHAAQRPRRVGRDADPRQVERRDGARQARHGGAGARALRARLSPGLRRGARDGTDRLGQVDDALRSARSAQHDRQEHHHDRGSRRVPARRHHAGAGQRQGRPAFPHRPALDDARRPRHHHGRRDPRPRDRADRGRVGTDRTPRALDAAHQRRGQRDRPPRRDGHRAVSRRLGDRLRRRAAAGTQALPALQGAPDHHVRGAAQQRHPQPVRHGGLRGARLPALRPLRLQGTRRPLRGHDGHRRDPQACAGARSRPGDRRGRRPPGDAPAARRRHREGPQRPDLDRRGDASDRQRLGADRVVGV
ncbi:MAG: Type IV fimbrial assembly, ATPase PilB, partial [uncultured Solirubrobacteraceae bacterium]